MEQDRKAADRGFAHCGEEAGTLPLLPAAF